MADPVNIEVLFPDPTIRDIQIAATIPGFSGYSGRSGFSGAGLSGFSGYSGSGGGGTGAYHDLTFDDLALSGVTSAGTATLVPGRWYYGSVGSALTIAFSATPSAGGPNTGIRIHATAPFTLTFPAAYEVGNTVDATITTLAVTTGDHEISWVYSNGQYWIADSIGSLSGYSGYSGISGFSGYSGKSGYSGYSGVGSNVLLFTTQTDTDYTLAITDANAGVNMVSAAAHNLTVPLNATVAFTIGTQVVIEQGGAGVVTIVAAGGVTLQGGTATAGQYTEVVLIKQATDTWFVATGNSGYSGYSGYSGKSGYSGYSSLSGFSGYSSLSGYSGYSGLSGYSGYSGISGYSGYSGISGYSGYSSLSGFSGYSSLSGFSGYSSLSGFSGYSGSGVSGYSGYSGISGFSGYSGYSGYSGISGYSGYSGLSGYSGYSAFSGYSSPSLLPLTTQTTTPYTLVANDAGTIVSMDNASSMSLLVPTNASVAFAVGTQIVIRQGLAGSVTISAVAPGTTTINATSTTTAGQWAEIVLVKTATDVWFAATSGPAAGIPITQNDYFASFTVPDTGRLYQPDALTLAGTETVTLAGTGQILLYDTLNSCLTIDKSSFSPGSFTLRSGEYLLQYSKLNLSGNQEVRLEGDSTIILTDLIPGSSFVMAGN